MLTISEPRRVICEECNQDIDMREEECFGGWHGETICEPCSEEHYVFSKLNGCHVHKEDVVRLWDNNDPVHYETARYDRHVDGYVLADLG